jgi:hypothetical protein
LAVYLPLICLPSFKINTALILIYGEDFCKDVFAAVIAVALIVTSAGGRKEYRN